jgi:PadR family transcriptional regulator, regulatory protein PadR
MKPIDQLRKGSTPLLLMTILSTGRMYGYQVMRECERRSQGYFSMTAALLYPALHQLEQDGLVLADWQDGPGKRRRKYYTLSDAGRKALAEHRSAWEEFTSHLFQALNAPAAEDR